MFKFLFRLILFTVGAFVAVYLLQDPQEKSQMQKFDEYSIMATGQKILKIVQTGPSSTCNCRVYHYGKWQYVTKTCPPGMTCAQCCNQLLGLMHLRNASNLTVAKYDPAQPALPRGKYVLEFNV